MATHSSVLAWRIPGTGELGGLPSMESHRVGHDWSDLAAATAATWAHAGSDGKESTCNEGDLGSIPGLGRSPGEGNIYPLQYSCLENPRDGGAWWAAVYGVTQSRTRLRRLSSNGSSSCLLRKILALNSSALGFVGVLNIPIHWLAWTHLYSRFYFSQSFELSEYVLSYKIFMFMQIRRLLHIKS